MDDQNRSPAHSETPGIFLSTPLQPPRVRCELFSQRMDDPQSIERFRQAERPGLYCRVLREGMVEAGDEVTVEPVRGEKTALLEIYRDYYEKNADEEVLHRFLRAPIAVRRRVDLEERLNESTVEN